MIEAIIILVVAFGIISSLNAKELMEDNERRANEEWLWEYQSKQRKKSRRKPRK